MAASDEPPPYLLQWVEEACAAPIAQVERAFGGNRKITWKIGVRRPEGEIEHLCLRFQAAPPEGAEPYTVKREAGIYRSLDGDDILAPRLLAEHRSGNAILLSWIPGVADRPWQPENNGRDDEDERRIMTEFVAQLVRIHRLDLPGTGFEEYDPVAGTGDYIRRELDIWRAMYRESGDADSLIDAGFLWLDAHVPTGSQAPVFLHGDAGPGNYLFQDGHLTGVLDWELSHIGDPMDDFGWYALRSVVFGGVPFADVLDTYSALSGTPIDRERLLYHCVLVFQRVLVIRHRNVEGRTGHSYLSRIINRRLMVEALCKAVGVPWPSIAAIARVATEQSALFDEVISEIEGVIAPELSSAVARESAMNLSLIAKRLRAVDRIGPLIAGQRLDAFEVALGARPATIAEGQAALVSMLSNGSISWADAASILAVDAELEARVAAEVSPVVAARRLPIF